MEGKPQDTEIQLLRSLKPPEEVILNCQKVGKIKLEQGALLFEAAGGGLAGVGEQVVVLAEGLHLDDEVPGNLTSLQRLLNRRPVDVLPHFRPEFRRRQPLCKLCACTQICCGFHPQILEHRLSPASLFKSPRIQTNNSWCMSTAKSTAF